MLFALSLSDPTRLYDNKACGEFFMSYEQSMPLREQAMEVLQESTTLLRVACNLMEQGNRKEAQRLQHEARNKRNVSVLLMAKANALEKDSGDNMASWHHDAISSRDH